MNLPISDAAQTAITALKVNKKVATSVTPWVVFLEIKGEVIDSTYQWPAADATEKPDVNSDNWKTQIWDSIQNKIISEYAKKPVYVAFEVCYVNSEGNQMSLPVFFKYCPDSGVPIKDKMMFGSCFQSLKRAIDVQGITPEISQASELEVNKFMSQAQVKGWVKL